jgi:hypothetical protein
MTTHAIRGAGAFALAALVLIWNEAPITDSPSFHVAAADQASPAQIKEAERDVPNVNSGPVTEQRSDAVVRGGRTGVEPAAPPAKRAPAPHKGRPDGAQKNVAH